MKVNHDQLKRMAGVMLVVALGAAACGDDDSEITADTETAASSETTEVLAAAPTSEADDEMSDDQMSEVADESHDHEEGALEFVEIPAEGAPTVAFEAIEHSDSGAVLHITTTDFEIVGDGVEPSGTEAYAGHIHVLVDGQTASMVYGDEHTLQLAPGENEVRIELADTDHKIMTVAGEPIAFALMVHIPETPADEFHTHEVEGHDH